MYGSLSQFGIVCQTKLKGSDYSFQDRKPPCPKVTALQNIPCRQCTLEAPLGLMYITKRVAKWSTMAHVFTCSTKSLI